MAGAGSIAIVEVNSDDQDATTNVIKTVSFVLLDITLRGQTINFTDNGWLAAGGFRSGEGTLTFTVPADAVLGTVFTVATTGTSPAFNPSASGDSVIAYVGSAASPTILFAVQFASGSAAWAADATSSTTSAVPAGLVNGDTALAFALDNAAYSGPLTGTAAEILANIANEANWTSSDAARVTPPGNFTVTGGGAGPTISINDVTMAEGDSGTTIFTFTVTRSDNTTAVTFDISTADGTASAGSDYFGNAMMGVSLGIGGALTQTFSVTVNGDTTTEANETFSVNLTNVTGATATDALGLGTITNDDVSIVRIYDIQGAGHTSSMAGQSVTTTGIVTAVDSNGFYLQDATGDGNTASSDGIFVFTSTAPTVLVGQSINITATVAEFLQSNNAQRLTLTELTTPTSITVLSSGNALPAAVLIGPDGIQPPSENIEDDNFAIFQPLTDGLDFWESLEGMLVTIQDPIGVSGNNSFNEFYAVTSRAGTAVAATGFNADLGVITIDGAITGGVNVNNTIGGDFNPERIQLQVDSTVTPGGVPTGVAPGARYNSVTGVVNYNAGTYEVVATAAVTVAQASDNVVDNTLLLGTTTRLTIGTYNAENLDPGDGAARFTALANDIIFALGAPGIVVLDEVQDNNGATNDSVVSASVTLQMLVDAIFAVSGVQYSWIDNPFITDDRNGGEPGGNIRVTMLYRTDTVSLVAGSVRTVTDPTDQANNSANPFNNSRLPLAADFTFNGGTVTVIGNHFTSKGGSSPLNGSVQPSTNEGEDKRAGQADLVNDFVDAILAGNANANVVVTGDLNDFQTEEPLRVLTGQLDWNGTAVSTGAGPQVLQNLSFLLPREERFSYIFEGNAQQIDHSLVSNGLSDGAQFDIVHRNTLFGEVNSDHDPLVTSIVLGRSINGTAEVDVLRGTAAGDVFTGLGANDNLSGKGGNDELYGGDGDDVISGGSGNDIMNGGDGNDLILVEEAGDSVVGGAGTDEVRTTLTSYTIGSDVEYLGYLGSSAFTGTGNALNNVMAGDGGNDRLDGLDGDDFLYGNGGQDTLVGGEGSDRAFGGDEIDGLFGENGNDYLYAGSGNDQLSGGAGTDTLYGDDGNDFLNGGGGVDYLIGGSGADIFNFDIDDTGATFGTADWIFDFDASAGDRINLGFVDAIDGGGDDAFTFIGSSAFSNVAGQLRAELINGSTYVMGDINGDGIADLIIRVDTPAPLTAADFTL